MKKKFSFILIGILTLLLAVGCSADKPEDTVVEFVEAMKRFDIEAMNSYINPEDSEKTDDLPGREDEEEDEFEEKFLEYIKENAKKITYDINESEINGDKAIVVVDFKYVDGAPIFKATIGDYMKEMFALAFSNFGEEISDEEYSEAFINSMDKQMDLIEETFTEKTLDIDCIKIEDDWYIDNPSTELFDVATSNMLTTMEEIDDSFNFDEEGLDDSLTEELEDEDINLIEKGLGDEIELKTLNLKITDMEETDLLASQYGSEKAAKEGAKFLLVSMEIINTTKSEFTFPNNFTLIDNEEREFNTYSDSIGAIDDYLNQRNLSPSIKEKGRLIYEIPEDSTNYYILIGKADTNDVYKIILK